MTANVLASNRNSSALIKLVHENEPDILVSLESDKWWQSKLDTLETRLSVYDQVPSGKSLRHACLFKACLV